jgi:hypothetical protein
MVKDELGSVLIYQTEDGNTKIDIKVENETVWMTAGMMAKLFNVDYSNILKHIKNIYKEHELAENMTMAKIASVVNRGARGKVVEDMNFYNLDMIISVGYRVNSIIAVHFRQWATKILKEYVIKGFVINDDRLKEKTNDYFDELLEKIRDIRSSEKVFYRKILDIYSTSIDYDPKTEITKNFFATIQNKIHWAVHGHTASELIYERVSAEKDFMGITNTKGKIKKNDITIAKNYLNEDELKILNRIVNMYLDFAELQALEKKPMTMADWINKLDDFLKITDKEILTHRGTISKLEADEKAIKEYDMYKERIKNNQLTNVEKHFLESIDEINKKVKKIKKLKNQTN